MIDEKTMKKDGVKYHKHISYTPCLLMLTRARTRQEDDWGGDQVGWSVIVSE